jgi:hypothetical protein
LKAKRGDTSFAELLEKKEVSKVPGYLFKLGAAIIVFVFSMWLLCNGLSFLGTFLAGPWTQSFVAGGLFTATTGTFNVECSGCTAIVTDTNTCYHTATGEEIHAQMEVIHNGETMRVTTYTAQEASGLWVIRDRQVNSPTGSTDYTNGGYYYSYCVSKAKITIVFTNGGTVTYDN